MGADVCLHIKDLLLLYWKSYFDKETLSLFFVDDDLIVNENAKYDIADDETFTQYKYSTTIQKAIDRLNAAGYTLKAIEEQFNEQKENCLDYWTLLYDLKIDVDEYNEVIKKRVEKNITFRKWVNSVRKYSQYLLTNKLKYHEYNSKTIPEEIKPKNECDRLVFNSISEWDSDSFFGCLYEEFDQINTIRIILENCDREDRIEVDITEMVGWTYSSIDEMRIGDTIEKNIVLVEGTSDKAILEFALKHIYPHLSNLYYFMDFEFAKDKSRQGGVEAIANNVKTFITSRLKGRFIAIFDNDTAGIQAKERLLADLVTVPKNFRILSYPSMRFAKYYPTISTNGKIILDDINGRACSIELYLPDFMLKKGIYSYMPIHWESYVKCKVNGKQLANYQGCISEKEEIKERFFKYQKAVEKGTQIFNIDEWQKMKVLLDEIIMAFN